MMNGRRKSDSCIVPAKSANNLTPLVRAEQMEGRRLVKGNAGACSRSRTLRRKWPASGTSPHTIGVPAVYHQSFSPKTRAGCVSSARPDLRRGCAATRIPTPTKPWGEAPFVYCMRTARHSQPHIRRQSRSSPGNDFLCKALVEVMIRGKRNCVCRQNHARFRRD
jgi:hypothetical protein